MPFLSTSIDESSTHWSQHNDYLVVIDFWQTIPEPRRYVSSHPRSFYVSLGLQDRLVFHPNVPDFHAQHGQEVVKSHPMLGASHVLP